MTRKLKQGAQVAACCAIVAAGIAGRLCADTPPSAYQLPSNSEVIGYLLQSVNWYRHVYTERQVANEPADLMFLDDSQAIERQIVKLSFEFAKADALLETSTASSHGRPPSSNPPPADLAHFIELKNRNDQLSQQAIEEIKSLDKRVNKAKGANRRKLKAAEEDALENKYSSKAEAYRAYRDPAEGLLMIYPISAASDILKNSTTRIRLFEDPDKAATVIAYAVSFPFSESDATVEYVAAPSRQGTL